MGADEPLSTREILDRFEGVRRDQKNTDDGLRKLASETVTTEAWARENGHLQKDIAEVDAHCEERHQATMKVLDEVKTAMGELKKSTHESLKELKASSEQHIKDLKSSLDKKREFTWTRALAIASILAMLAAAWYTALHQGGH